MWRVQIINSNLNLVVETRYYNDLGYAQRFGEKRKSDKHTYVIDAGEFRKLGY